ncbi:uncharacterized protein LOC121418129 [Lytechinus variegatus]|uniref:uncharacterized protein LOC121418129 n=1 Tax=Lytechinus variegatus TaxID=7654 RepID=UPI001BB21FD6|nr:uncharacterized protein LOC121418129 [Lytechinus variegatus]
MEKAENADIQNLQNAAGDSVASPNTRRRLLKMKAPKLHIKIPFLKRGFHVDDGRGCHSADVVSNSLPNESFMPSKIYDVELYHDCEECGEEENLPEGDHDSSIVAKAVEPEDEADSDKHQSDLDENEKDNEKEMTENGQDNSQENTATEEIEKVSTEGVAAPSTKKGCLKPCLKVNYHGRRRASTYPGPHDCLEASFKRCVTFSPDTVEPATRNCKYREWIEKKCIHPRSPQINVKHEKRKCQLNQMRKVNISDYMSKNYGSSFFSPIGSFGGDMLL